MNKPESAIQQQIRSYLKLRGIESVSVPNGSVLAGDAKARARQMAALKRDGLRVGFPDLLVLAPEGRLAFIEVKTDKGRLSDSQKECHEWLLCLGHKVAVCRCIEDVDEALRLWGFSG